MGGKRRTHLLPTARPILNSIPSLGLHLLPNRHTIPILINRITPIIDPRNRRRNRAINATHLPIPRRLTILLLEIRGEAIVVALAAETAIVLGGFRLLVGVFAES